MPSKYWIKLYHEILDDPKMGRLPDPLWRRTIEIFLLAGDLDSEGVLPAVDDMAWRLRVDYEALVADLEALAQVGIVTLREDGHWTVTKFCERQAPVSASERGTRYRERQRRADYYDAPTEPEREPNESFADTDTDTDTDKTLAADAAPQPEPQPEKPKRQPTGQNALKAELEEYFADISGIPKPAANTKRQRSTAAVRWWNPLVEIAHLVDDDVGCAKKLIAEAVERMRADKLTCAAPQSIVSHCQSIVGEWRSPNGKRSPEIGVPQIEPGVW